MEGPIVRAGVIIRRQFNGSCDPIILQLLMNCLYAQYFQYSVPGRVELGGRLSVIETFDMLYCFVVNNQNKEPLSRFISK